MVLKCYFVICILLFDVVLCEETTESKNDSSESKNDSSESKTESPSLDLDLPLMLSPLNEAPEKNEPSPEELAKAAFFGYTTETTEDYDDETDRQLSKAELDEALNMDVGEYSTMTFQYINDQFVKWQNVHTTYFCYDDFIKCTISQVIRQPVCAINKNDKYYRGLRTLPSICDMYLDNCRRRVRFWHAMKYGSCGWYSNYYRYDLLYPQGKK